MPKVLSIVFAISTVAFAALYFSAKTSAPGQGIVTPREQDGAAVSGPAEEEEYVFVAVSASHPYWIDTRAGLADAARELGVKGTFTGPNGSDVTQQVECIEAAIVRGVKGLLVVPAEPEGLVPSINKAIAAGIPVVTVDTDSPKSDRYMFIGTGNYEAGRVGGEMLAKEIGGEGDVAIIMLPGQWNLEERRRGYEDSLAKYPGTRVVQIGNDQSDPTQAASVAKSILQAHPGLAGFGCVGGAGGLGAAVAVRDAGKKGKVKIIGMDRDDTTLEFIKSGYIQASLAQRSYTMAYLALKMVHDLNHGRVRMLKDWRAAGVCPLPELVDTGVAVITPENFEDFYH